ncbi:NAD(P)-dependent dehydrogenase (short-subunit alcohol dehydrogenase family) [Nonomuraea thailandensis]|uniref:NAD(P)-dependent dehydrogenase (Short-subunit alcohol dehydrogenase family) n=1 Tax=Nonomuraea thailandensis TaxID=1188745 RepID=A0A9X2GIY3_9ACTN|nr:SDR family NAD(P)-dependent oxidoreductase [Nonomuraea thailandensis]MCP2358710.1 NAD(P)-dependent dehydrogenase (short-subunit alcohol dehydrogenase family) [Nonomuraea thailandensis]
MSSIVITGGTRGLGLGLARALVERGHQVMVCGTDPGRVRAAEVAGVSARVADVTDRGQLQELWDSAAGAYGRVDVWINNAGVSHAREPAWRLPADQARHVLDVNLAGVLNGCAVAIGGMAAQGGGHVWNLEGLGTDGRVVPGLGVYGATKRAVGYLTGALAKEVPGGVSVGLLSPGMVVTDLLTHGYSQEERRRSARVLSILADRVETVAPWLADRVVSRARNGARVRWLTPGKIAWRFATARFVRRAPFTAP